MKLLGFESSAKAVSTSLLSDGALLAEYTQNSGQTHSRTLMEMAKDMLVNCGLTPQDIDTVAVAAGPGSFTGVRIGVSAAKGFAWGADLPCYGVSTLEAMARSLGVYQGYVLGVMDARRAQVYAGLFHADCGKYTRVMEDSAISLEDLREVLQKCSEPIFLVGDGSILCYNTLLESVPALVLPPEHRMHQRADGVALAALEMIDRGDPGDGITLTPNYLRLSQAERERLARGLKITVE